jgi:ABC-type transport system substrate-binding protein
MAHRADPPVGFDPMRTPSINSHQVTLSIFGGGNLVKACREDVFKVCPGLAEKWESSSDATQWTFKVRDDVRWHDGAPFTAQDVKYWIELAYNGAKVGDKTRIPAYYKSDLGDLKKVEALEGNRLRITLGKRDPYYLEILAQPHYSIGHPRHLLQPRIEAGDVGVSPQDIGLVGTGPFKFLKYEKGTRVQVRRSDIYFERDAQGRRMPYLDGIDFAITADPGAMDAAFRVGRLDGGSRGTAHNLTKERVVGYERDLGDKVWFLRVGYYLSQVGFNVLKPGPWQDVRVRRAMQLWIDKEAAIPATLGGYGDVFTLLDPTSPYTSPDFLTWPGWNLKTREQDKAEAKRLMAEAGYAKGFQIPDLCRRENVHRYEFVAGQLAGLGIEAKINCLDPAGWTAARARLDHAMEQGGYTAGVVIPEMAELQLTRHSISPTAHTKHEDPRVPEFFDRLRAATSFEQRVKIFREMERYMMWEQAYLIPLFGDTAITPFRSHVKGLVVASANPNNNWDFATVWLDK